MKIRLGHVSNSSTSSFIIAMDPTINEWIVETKSFSLDELDEYFSGYEQSEEFIELVKDKGTPSQINLINQLLDPEDEDNYEFEKINNPIELMKRFLEAAPYYTYDLDNVGKAIEKGFIFRVGYLGHGGMDSEGGEGEYLLRTGLKSTDKVLIIAQPPK